MRWELAGTQTGIGGADTLRFARCTARPATSRPQTMPMIR